jgi:tRNA (guanine-N7-)-methyltransferase
MTVGQERAWERHWPQLGQDVLDLPAGPLDTDAWFGRSAPVVLEIGSGMGETTSKLAAAAPDVNYLAAEVYQAGLAQLMMRAEDLGVENLRLLRGDAVILLTQHIEPASLSEVRLYFPDPWPKKRHHKRRIVQPDFVALVASRLVPGGRFHMATDWEHYAQHMLAVCNAEPSLCNVYSSWAPRPDWRPVTKFESRAHTEERNIRDLIFKKVHAE